MRSQNPERFLDHHLQRARLFVYFFMNSLLSGFNYSHFASGLLQGLHLLAEFGSPCCAADGEGCTSQSWHCLPWVVAPHPWGH